MDVIPFEVRSPASGRICADGINIRARFFLTHRLAGIEVSNLQAFAFFINFDEESAS